MPKHRAAVGERGIHAVAFDAGAEAMRRLDAQHIEERAAKPHGLGAQLLAERIAIACATEHVGVVAHGDDAVRALLGRPVVVFGNHRAHGFGDAGGKTHQVKLKRPNGYGLYDMSGNVCEWCWDRYEDEDTVPASVPLDYAGETGDLGDRRVRRSGGLCFGSKEATCAFRTRRGPDYWTFDTGLRLVCRP